MTKQAGKRKKAPAKPRSRWRYARYAAWSILVLLVLLLALTSSFYAYAAMRQDVPYREAAPASGSYVQGGDVEIFVQERGPRDGPPVLLIHGTGAWSGLWGETMDALAAQGYRAIALDLPPFGYSEKPANGAYETTDQARRITGVLDSLDLSRVTLVAHSFGSRAAMEAVLAQPDRFERVVLVDAALDFNATRGEPNALLTGVLSVPPLRNLLVASTVENPLLTRTFLKQLIHNDSAATDERVALLQQPLVIEGLTRDAGLWLRTFLAPERPNLSNDASSYARLGMPVLLLWGAEDTVTPPAKADGLLALIPGARLVVLEGVGHIPQIEEPAAFQGALLDFLGPAGA